MHRSILTFIIIIAVSCVPIKESDEISPSRYYIENQLSFFDPYETIYVDGKYQGYTYDVWIRQPHNLKMIHETFKKIGYNNLISEYHLFENPCLLWGYVNRPLNQIIDSLVITYPFDTISTEYYREFWQRRKEEKNDRVVFEILQEVSEALVQKKSVEYDETMVNDTLYNLVLIDQVQIKPNETQAKINFEYLKNIGMHGSAYNLLYERYDYQDVNWNKDILVKQLRTDSLPCCPRTWIIDDTK